MCLKIKEKYKTYDEAELAFNNPMVAKKDIKVWKLFDKSEEGILRPPYWNRFSMTYEIGKKYNSEMTFSWSAWHGLEIHEGLLEIHEGLHSFNSWITIILHRYINYGGNHHYRNGFTLNAVLRKCTIPVGSKYFIGEEGEVVSDTLIIGK